jgi:hypothetical protein
VVEFLESQADRQIIALDPQPSKLFPIRYADVPFSAVVILQMMHDPAEHELWARPLNRDAHCLRQASIELGSRQTNSLRWPNLNSRTLLPK